MMQPTEEDTGRGGAHAFSVQDKENASSVHFFTHPCPLFFCVHLNDCKTLVSAEISFTAQRHQKTISHKVFFPNLLLSKICRFLPRTFRSHTCMTRGKRDDNPNNAIYISIVSYSQRQRRGLVLSATMSETVLARTERLHPFVNVDTERNQLDFLAMNGHSE